MKPLFNSSDKKVIFFDLYDTIIDRDLSFTQALKTSLEEFTARWDSEEWNPTRAVDAYEKEWVRRAISIRRAKGVKASSKKRQLIQTKEQRQLYCLTKALQDSPFDVTSSFLRILLKRTKELARSKPILFSDVKHTLEQLKQQKYTLALISNGKRERLIQALKYVQLDPIFPNHTVIAPSSPRTRKPHQSIFHKALKTMEIKPHQAIMVGNSWKSDIFGGNRCGIDTVWIQPKNQKIHLKRIGRNRVVTIARFKQLGALFN